MFDNFNVNLRKNKGFLTYIPYVPIPEYGQSNALNIRLHGMYAVRHGREISHMRIINTRDGCFDVKSYLACLKISFLKGKRLDIFERRVR